LYPSIATENPVKYSLITLPLIKGTNIAIPAAT
jgi:hypothetical protein